VKLYFAKNNYLPFLSPVFPHTGIHVSKKLPPSSLALSLVNFLLWRALQQKQHHQDLHVRDTGLSAARSVTVLGPRSQDTIGVQTNCHNVVMMFRVHTTQ